ncbi:pentapeptide repeat-containing protein [Streptomyces sp. AD2-2]|nr:pentapeptide repeat-containing protein [Streptomyces sp. AD2-2]
MPPAVGHQRDVYVPPLQQPAQPKAHPNPRQATAEEFEDDAVLSGVHFDGVSLAGLSAEVVEMDHVRLVQTRLTGATFSRCVLSELICNTVDFANLRAQDTSLLKSTITTSRLTGSHWTSGQFTDVVFEGGRGDMAQFRHSKFRRVIFRDVNLRQADFQFAEMAHVTFDRCDLTGVQFGNITKLNRVEFTNCTMLDISGTAGLKGATVRGPGAMELGLSLAREAGIVIEQ